MVLFTDKAVLTVNVQAAVAVGVARPLRRNLLSTLVGMDLHHQHRRAIQVAATEQRLAPSVFSSGPSALEAGLHTRVSSLPRAF